MREHLEPAGGKARLSIAKVLSVLSPDSRRRLAFDNAREIELCSKMQFGAFKPAKIPTIVANLEKVMPSAIEGCYVAGEQGKQYGARGKQVMGKHVGGAALKPR